jgi:two-component system sensor histidine kinase/response regulator
MRDDANDTGGRVAELAAAVAGEVYRRTDRLFAGLLTFEWLAAVALALWVAPLAWAGADSRVHPHVWAATLLGLAVVSLPVAMALLRPGSTATRHVVAAAQMAMSALLIHLSGGRIETHFHVFGSLAFLSIYRDWRVLVTASAVTAADHIVRGALWPESEYGTAVGPDWRWLEHSGWVVFIDIVLVYACVRGQSDIRRAAERAAALEASHASVERQVKERTRELESALADRELTEARLRRSDDVASKLALVASYTHNAVVITDAAGRVEWVNDGFTRITGYAADRVVGKRPGELLQGKDTDPATAAVMRAGLTAGTGFEVEVVNYSAGGRPYWIEIECRPVRDARGVLTNFIAIESDITARKAAARDLEAAVRAAETASRTKSEFLANMSHEIRTPMNGILGMTGLVLETDLSADQRESLGMVKSSADALLTVINDILDFSKIEAGKLDLDPIPYVLPDAVGDALKALAQKAHEKGLELACDIRPGVPTLVVGDAGRLRQVLTNLVGNAIKFTDRGEVVVRAERVPGDGPARRVRFSVADTGIGIPTGKLGSVFEPFTQADGSTTRKYGGTGLGLTISTRLVELMGGRLWAESEPGKGSTFLFELELEPASGSIETRIAIPADLRGLPVLVIDDNATNRRVLGETLKLWGAVPTCVESGPDGLAELRRRADAGEPYPLVLLDGMMPDMDGFMVAGEVRRDPAIAGVPLLMLTSADRKGDAALCRELGVASYLIKPVKPADLNRAIAAALLPAAPKPVRPATRAARPAGPPARPLRVLLAEDNAVNQRVAVRLLEKLGHSVEVAGDGAQAAAAVDREQFDIVFMDVQMPVMDGFEATRLIRDREVPTGRRLRIAAMTAHAMKGDRERCLAAGMDDYLAKPVQTAELEAVLARAADYLAEASLEPPTAPSTPLRGAAFPKGPNPDEDDLPAAFDRAEALERLGGDEELFAEIAGLFLDDAPKLLAGVRSGVSAGDAAAVRRAAHGLKGAAGYVGGTGVAAAAQLLETMAADGDLTAAPATLAALTRETNRLLTAVATAPEPVGA